MKTAIVAAYNTQIDMTKEFLNRMQETVDKSSVYFILVHGYVGDEPDITHPIIDKFIRIKNIGFCNTINEGLKAVPDDCDYIFVVGNDSFPVELGWLDKLIKIQQDTSLPLICPADQWSTRSPRGTETTINGHTVYLNSFYPSIAYLLPMNTFKKIGLFDERFYGAGYYADNDYCDRILAEYGPYTIGLVRDVVLTHRLSQEGQSLNVTRQMGELQVVYLNKLRGV